MLIGLTGKKSSGKTYSAISLKELGFKRLSFSTPLKEILKEISFPRFTEEMKNSNNKITMDLSQYNMENIEDTPRRCMQILGTDIILSLIHI